MTSLLNRWKQPRTAGSAPATAPQVDLCEICGLKPKYVEGTFKHPYCSRSCARNGSVQGGGPSACTLRGCRSTGRPAFANFCSEQHAREGVRLGLVQPCSSCNAQPRAIGENCLTCDRRLRAPPPPPQQVQHGPGLKEIDVDGPTFKSLRAQFTNEWERSRGTPPRLEKAYEVTLPRDIRSRHDAYRASQPNTQEIRTFHSSQCICDLGTKGPSPCSFHSCGICNIIKSSFRAFAFGAPANNGRFGDGIYSYRNPAQADNFATSCLSSPYRVMIACDTLVLAGQVPENDKFVKEESIFAPQSDAILPAYVLMYTR